MLKFALRNLMSRPVRSLLSFLGLTVAIVGMVGLFSVARGVDHTLTSTFGRIPGLLAMQPGAPIPLFSRIPADWEQEIAAVEGVATVNSEVWQRVNLIDGKMIMSPPRFLFGTNIETRLRLESDPYRQDMLPGGRFLNVDDVGTRNTVISKQIAEEFHVGPGDVLNVNGYELTVVGIYHCGSLLLDTAVILDIGQVRAMSRFDAGSVSAFYIEPIADIDDRQLSQEIRDIFRGRDLEPWRPSASDLNVGPRTGAWGAVLEFFSQPRKSPNSPKAADGPAPKVVPERRSSSAASEAKGKQVDRSGSSLEFPLEVRSATEWSERFSDLTADLNLFLGVMTAIGVSIATLSIVNTMLMSVSERLIEFGILKANGWSRIDVLKLITCESAALGLTGGVVGSALGWVVVGIINSQWPERVQLYASPGLLAFSVCFATALGVLGGLYPAVWAMRISPMEAIRRG